MININGLSSRHHDGYANYSNPGIFILYDIKNNFFFYSINSNVSNNMYLTEFLDGLHNVHDECGWAGVFV
jgi:hypothetical protein